MNTSLQTSKNPTVTSEGWKYYDLTPLVSERLEVFPGDVSFSRESTLAFDQGHHLNVSFIKTTLHLGAHADAPSHFDPKGQTIENRDLSYYVGPCQVIEVSVGENARIYPKDIEGTKIQAARVFFKTNSYPDPDTWTKGFNSLSPELVEFLVERGVKTVGIDTPSVDPEVNPEVDSHRAILKHDLANIEGLLMTEVPEGLYFLMCAPLRIKGADASPLRVLLFEFDQMKNWASGAPS